MVLAVALGAAAPALAGKGNPSLPPAEGKAPRPGPAILYAKPAVATQLGNAKGSKVKGKFKVAPFPTFEGAGKAGILGGHNLVISTFSKNAPGAVKLIDFLSSPEIEQMYAAKYSIAPTLSATYDDPAVKQALPFAAELKQAVEQAKSRPVSPVYPQISQAIYKNVNEALAGQMSPQDALKNADDQINRALATF